MKQFKKIMIVTDKFVFIHLHKAGGSFVRKVIVKLFPLAKQIGYHFPLEMLPSEYRHLPVLGVVRNPWEFYVSYYAFQTSLIAKFQSEWEQRSAVEYDSLVRNGIDPRNGIDILFDVFAEESQVSFPRITSQLLNLSTSEKILDKILEVMPTELNRRGKYTPIQCLNFRGKNVTKKMLEKIRGTNEGYCTFLFKHMYGTGENIFFAKQENLRSDLLSFFEHIGVSLEPQMKNYILTASPENSSHHHSYADYYTQDLAHLVQQKDAFLIERFGFSNVEMVRP